MFLFEPLKNWQYVAECVHEMSQNYRCTHTIRHINFFFVRIGIKSDSSKVAESVGARVGRTQKPDKEKKLNFLAPKLTGMEITPSPRLLHFQVGRFLPKLRHSSWGSSFLFLFNFDIRKKIVVVFPQLPNYVKCI
jgi:hypothetical protein